MSAISDLFPFQSDLFCLCGVSFSLHISEFLHQTMINSCVASVFAYGQTSSGKTFTMTGITEYAIGDIYEYIQKVNLEAILVSFANAV